MQEGMFRNRLRSRYRWRRIRSKGHFGQRAACLAIIFHRDRDTTVHPNNGGQVLEQAIGTKSTQKTVPGGHDYTRTTHTDRDRERSSG
jgi:hypothetical protein